MAQMVHGVDPANNAALAELEGKTGPSNFYRAMAHKPDVLAAFPKFYGAVMGPGTLARNAGTPVRFEDRAALDRLAGGAKSHQGIIALGSEKKYAELEDIAPASALIVVLD